MPQSIVQRGPRNNTVLGILHGILLWSDGIPVEQLLFGQNAGVTQQDMQHHWREGIRDVSGRHPSSDCLVKFSVWSNFVCDLEPKPK